MNRKEFRIMSDYELKNNLLSFFYESNKQFLISDYNNILLNVSERNLCSSLAIKMSGLLDKYHLSGYYADVEYNRNGDCIKTIINGEQRVIQVTCDLILHSRGENKKDNLLAIEMKKLPCDEADLAKDRDRLIALTKHDFSDVFSYGGKVFPKNVCDYEVGIYYLIDVKKRMITLEIYNDGKIVNTETKSFAYYQNY